MTLLERAARAICDELEVDPDRIVTAENDAPIVLGLNQEHPAWTRYVSLVEKILVVMREPSQTMVIKGAVAHAVGGEPLAIWQAMVAAALVEK